MSNTMNNKMNANTNGNEANEKKMLEAIVNDICGIKEMPASDEMEATDEAVNVAVEEATVSFANDVMSGNEPELDVGIQTTEETDECAEVLESAKEAPVKEVKKFKTSNQTVCVKTYLNRFKSGEVKIPDCQRMFVWTDKQVEELMNSIRSNMAIPALQLGEVDGVAYLVDGLQRTTALMKLAEDKKISEEDKKTLLSYKIAICTTHDMDWESFNRWFYNCNNGTPLATAVKESAKLSSDLQNAVLSLAGHEFFREAPSKKTAQKGDHKRVIAMSFMCSAAELTPGTISSQLTKTLTISEGPVMRNYEKAKANLQIVIDGISQLKKEFVEKSYNAAYMTAWGVAMTSLNNINADEIAEVTMRIFEGSKALPGYRKTTGSGANSKDAVNKRAAFYISEVEKLRKERTLEWESKAI